MRQKLMVLAAAVVMAGAAALALGLGATPVDAAGSLCGPIGVGWTCTCSTSVLPNVVCLTGDGGPGHVYVTTCTACPPPCHDPGCNIQFCRPRTSITCR